MSPFNDDHQTEHLRVLIANGRFVGLGESSGPALGLIDIATAVVGHRLLARHPKTRGGSLGR